MKKIIFSIVIFLLCTAPLTLAENLSVNKDLLEEIDIMETVLTRMMGKDTSVMAFRGSNANGYYLPDYGVIFNVAYSVELQVSMVFINSPEAVPAPAAVSATGINQVISRSDGGEKEKKDVIPDVKKSLIIFFNKYASSMSTLKRDEKITVIVDLNGSSFIPSARKNNSPQQLTATLSTNDLEDFKKNKISGDELEKRVVFNELDSVDQDVSIFSNIIQTSLAHMKEESGFGFQGNVKNIRIQGHGILFMVNADFGIKTFRLLNRNLEDLEQNLKAMEETMKDKEKKLKTIEKEKIVNTGNTKIVKSSRIPSSVKADDVKEYEEKLIKVISKYGHTLSKIKPDEYVEIALNFNGVRMDKDFSKGILKVRKSDIDAFHKGKIDYDNFSKKASMIYY